MASTYLSATLGTATNRKKWTYSAWVKKSRPQASIDEQIFGSYADATTSYYSRIADNGSSKFEFTEYNGSGYSINLRPANKQRDTHGWYHIVIGYDSTQATASNRVKFYINGEQVTTWTQESYPSLNYESGINKNQLHTIGKETSNSSYYYDGSMSHIHFIDGTQYAASDFGSTDSTTGEWKINTSPNVTYGNNGFFILKDGNSVTDQSGEGNNWTVGGGTLTKTEDCPSNVFATINPLHPSLNTGRSFANGNTYVVLGGTARVPEVSTIGMTSGKFYAEMKDISGSGGGSITGITGQMYRGGANDYLGSKAYDYAYYSSSGDKINDTNETSFGNSYTDGDIIGIAVDLDNLKIYFSKNGVWQNSGDPTSGSTGTGAAFTLTAPSSTVDGAYFFACSDDNAYAERRMAWNFGNGFFQTTAVSSAGTNASNNGIFEYDVPTGYTALSTKGLNE